MLTVGTKVKILGDSSGYLSGTIGTIGTVVEVDNRNTAVINWYFIELPYYIMGDNKWLYLESELEVITNETKDN